MKNFKKVISFFILIAILFSVNINKANAEGEENIKNTNESSAKIQETCKKTKERKKTIYLTKSILDNWPHRHKLRAKTNKLSHKPAWMYSGNLIENCKKGTIYFVLSDDGKKMETFSYDCDIKFEEEEKNKEFIDSVFKGEKNTENNTTKVEDEETDLNSATDSNDSTTEENNESESNSDEKDVDGFIEDLLGTSAKSRLKNISLINNKIFLSGNKMAKSIRAYSYEKQRLEIKRFEISGIKGLKYYNGLLANLFTKFENSSNLNSSKNKISKILSNISFSFSSYINEDLNDEIKETFRKKFISDLKKLKISYLKIQKQDTKITNFLLKKS